MTSEHKGPERREVTREREREREPEAAPAPDAEAAPDPEADAEAQADVQPEAQTEPDADADADTGADADAGSTPESVPAPEPPEYPDRCYRSPSAIAGGVVLLALSGWLGADAVFNGPGRTPMVALAGLLLFVPSVVAYTLRPAVFAGTERMRVRNPLRTITVPWPSVESLQAGYTSEVIADDGKYQLWAIPVSLRARKGVNKHNARVQAGEAPHRSFLGFGKTLPSEADMTEQRAASDHAIDELRELALRHGEDGEAPAPTGHVTVRWAYEILVPALLGAIALTALLATR